MRTILGIIVVFFFVGLVLVGFATSSPASGVWGGQVPEHVWSKGLGGFGTDTGYGVAVDASGNVIVVGSFQNAVDFGGGTLVSAGDYDIVVAKYNANGVHQWSKRFGSTGADKGFAVGVDGAGNVFVTGFFTGTVDFGGGGLTPTVGYAIFLAKYNANGVHQWSKSFETTVAWYPTGLAADGSGNVVVTGGFLGTANLGGGNLVSAGDGDIFVAKYSASGAHQWSKRFGSTDLDVGSGIAADGSGNVLVTGLFEGTVNFGGANLVSAGNYEIFLAKYDASGVHQWSRRFGGTDNDWGIGLAVDGSANIVLTGLFSGTVDFGGGNLVSAGVQDIFLAKYTANGVHQWSKRFGGAGYDSGTAVTVDGTGEVTVTGSFQGSVNFGGKANLVSAGGDDAFVTKYRETGVYEWGRDIGGALNDRGSAVGADGLGNVFVAGSFEGNVNFGGGVIGGSGGSDIFLAKYGNPPGILHIADIRRDEGGVVAIHFQASAHDAFGMDPLVTRYQAFRQVNTPVGPTWTEAAETPATLQSDYMMDASTDADSSCASGPYYSFFFVRAMTTDAAVFYDSPIDSGYSVDNLAPPIPANLTYHAGQLTWDPSGAADFDHFSVYGANSNSFALATFVNTTGTPGMNVASYPYLYYFVTATDHACNEGKPAGVGTLTGVGGTPTSYVLSVSAYPNPFNPETTVRYTPPSRGRVTIKVFDARGARVATLVDAVTPAGAYTVTWNGHDDRGNAVSSGVFFARLTSIAGERTYKMTLLK